MAERKVFAVKANKATSPTSKITHERLLRHDLSKHSLGMTALISPLVGSLGGLGSRGL